jgi:hypothetical protein
VEERVVQRQGNGGLKVPRYQQKASVERVQTLQTSFATGCAHLSMEVMRFLRSGLETHIEQMDMVRWSQSAAARVRDFLQCRADGMRDVLTLCL